MAPHSSHAGWLVTDELQLWDPKLRGALQHGSVGMWDAAQLQGSVKWASKAWVTRSLRRLHTRETGQPCFFSLTIAFTHCCLELAASSTLPPCSEITHAGGRWCVWEERKGATSLILQRRFCEFSSFLQHEHLERNTSPETPSLVLFRQKAKDILGARCHGWQIRTRVPGRGMSGCVSVSSQHQTQSTQDSKTC